MPLCVDGRAHREAQVLDLSAAVVCGHQHSQDVCAVAAALLGAAETATSAVL